MDVFDVLATQRLAQGDVLGFALMESLSDD